MLKLRRPMPPLSLDHTLFIGKRRKAVPHEFVLEALAPLLPYTCPMFGCLAVYVKDKIVLVLRDKRENTAVTKGVTYEFVHAGGVSGPSFGRQRVAGGSARRRVLKPGKV
jgi:hypothetical protein